MKYVDKYKSKVEQFINVCKRLSEKMYVTSHGGNLAWKLEDDLILITPTRITKSDITHEDLVFIDINGNKLEGIREATGEILIYLNIFRERLDVVSIIHCHPPYTNAFAIIKGKNWLMRPIFPETVVEVGPVPLIPYEEPLTQKLADNFKPLLDKYNAFLMENHGLVIISPHDIPRNFQLIEILESTSISILHALSVGKVKEISKKEVKKLENTMKTRKLPMFGAPGVNKSLVDLYFSE